MKKVETFRVMDLRGNTLNTIMVAEAERPGDTYDTCVEKRRAEAQRKCQRWLATYYLDETLIVVACDSMGKPINARSAQL